MSIEQGPEEPEKTIEEKIEGFKGDFESWLNENPDIAQQLKNDVLSMTGVEENELVDPEMNFDMSLQKIPVSELSIYGTYCGHEVDNKCFPKKVIDFLQSKNTEFIICIGDNKEPKISSAAINISGKDADKFEKMIDKNQGSLRADNSKIDGWSIFESE